MMTHASVPVEVRQQLGIADTLIRLSVGIEALPDLIDDLAGALQVGGTQYYNCTHTDRESRQRYGAWCMDGSEGNRCGVGRLVRNCDLTWAFVCQAAT